MKAMITTIMLVSIVSFSGFAKDDTLKASTPGMREKAALMLEQMATCLRSKKTSEQCHMEMQTNCSKIMNTQGCPMMKDVGGMMYMEGMHDEQGMKGDNKPVEKK